MLTHTIRRSIFGCARLAVISLTVAGIVGCHRQAQQPVTVKLLTDAWIPPDDLPAVKVLSDDFARQTGIGLEMMRGVPAETRDQISLIRKLLGQPADGPDVVEVDVTWLGTLKSDLLDLAPYFQGEAGSISPILASSYIMNGKVLAIAHQNQAGALAYRADLLRKYGYDHPPRTWSELESMALRIQAGERAAGNKDFWGYLWPGAAEESLTCNALEWQVDEGGGHIIEKNGTISVNNPAAIRAWQRARHWIGWISPPSVPEYREKDAMRVFLDGRGAFTRVWGAEAGGLSTHERPELQIVNWTNHVASGEAGLAPLPAGSVARVATLGGAGFAISPNSRHPKEDAALIHFLLGEELKTYRKESFSLPQVTYAAAVSSSKPDPLRAVIVARPTDVSGERYEQVSMAYSRAVHSVLAGKQKGSDAASELEQELVRITGLHAGPPAKE